jgi:DNA-binding beta-propeller fold protein YncE
MKLRLAVAAVTAAVAVAGSAPGAAPRRSDPPLPAAFAPIRLTTAPGRVLARCRSIERRAHVPILCPTLLPRAFAGGIPGVPPPALVVTPMGDFFQHRITGVDIAYGAPWESGGWRAHRWRNRPCCFFHFDVFRRSRSRRAIPPGSRRARLGGRDGLLVPAREGEFYGNGLYWANHVRFLWQEHGVPYVATLHTFGERPTERLLGRLVGSLRPVDAIAPKARRGVPLGTTPNAVAVGPGTVWVAALGDLSAAFHGIVYGVDRTTGAVVARYRTTSGAHAVALANGELWIATWRSALARYDVGTERRLASLEVGKWPRALAVGGGSLWVADAAPFARSGSLVRVDPRRARATDRVALGRAPIAVTAAGGSVWVADELDDEVVRVDMRTLRVRARIAVGPGPTELRAGASAVWAANSGGRSVSRIDRRTNRVTTIPVGLAPLGLAVGGGAVWAACTADGTIWRIDPRTNRAVRAWRGLDAPIALAVTGRSLWVATNGNGELVRLRLPSF